MHRFRPFLCCPQVLQRLVISCFSVALVLAISHLATMMASPALLAGIAMSLTNVAYLAIFATAGVLALAKGIEIPILWAFSSAMGAALTQFNSSLPLLGIALVSLWGGWQLVRQDTRSGTWIVPMGVILCCLPLVWVDPWFALTGEIPLTASLLYGLPRIIPWSVSGTIAYSVGLLLGQLIISLVAYQSAFWLFWHLGERTDVKFRWGGFVVCGVAAAYCSSTIFG